MTSQGLEKLGVSSIHLSILPNHSPHFHFSSSPSLFTTATFTPPAGWWPPLWLLLSGQLCRTLISLSEILEKLSPSS